MAENHKRDPPRVAIVGGGISGMACSWKLRESDCLVDIYEGDDRLGGHADSIPFTGNGKSINVDTGFIAMNESTYPNFNAFLKQLGINTIPTDMSFGVSVNHGIFEWGSYSLWSFIGKASNLLNPWFWRLLFDLLRFSLFAPDVLTEGSHDTRTALVEKHALRHDTRLEEDFRNNEFESIGSYLRRQGYSEDFLRLVVIPMVAAPWCTDPDEFSRQFPAKPLIHFMMRQSLLDTLSTTLRWRSFRNGSKTYVDAFQQSLPSTHKLYLRSPVRRITRTKQGASLLLQNGSVQLYDHVVLAIHANQALDLLGNEATSLEHEILGCFKTSKNTCYLHSDTSLLPKRSSAQVAWNCLLESYPLSSISGSVPAGDIEKFRSSKISITFDMNKLQGIPTPGEYGSPGRVLVTMNPTRKPLLSQSARTYYHPLITSEAIIASRHIHRINGLNNVSFAGAWMGWGFHEDGFVAGTHAAEVLMHGYENTRTLDLFGLSSSHYRSPRATELAARWILSKIQSLLVPDRNRTRQV